MLHYCGLHSHLYTIDCDRTTARHAPKQRMISQPIGQWIFGKLVDRMGDGLSFARREPAQ